MKSRQVGAELFHEEGQTDMTKLNSHFPQLCERAPKREDATRSSTQDVPTPSNKLCAARSSTASHRA